MKYLVISHGSFSVPTVMSVRTREKCIEIGTEAVKMRDEILRHVKPELKRNKKKNITKKKIIHLRNVSYGKESTVFSEIMSITLAWKVLCTHSAKISLSTVFMIVCYKTHFGEHSD